MAGCPRKRLFFRPLCFPLLRRERLGIGANGQRQAESEWDEGTTKFEES